MRIPGKNNSGDCFIPRTFFVCFTCLLQLHALRNGKGWLTQRILAKPSNSFKFTGENELIQKSMCLRYLSARLARIFAQKITNRFFWTYQNHEQKNHFEKFGTDQETKKEKGTPKGGIWKKNEIANFSFFRGLYARRIALTTTNNYYYYKLLLLTTTNYY